MLHCRHVLRGNGCGYRNLYVESTSEFLLFLLLHFVTRIENYDILNKKVPWITNFHKNFMENLPKLHNLISEMKW